MKKIILSLALMLGIIAIPVSEVSATVSSNINKVIYAGDGVSTSFNFGTGGYSVPVYYNTDIQVYIETNSTGAITQLTLNNQYSVTLTQVAYSLTNTVVYYTAVINLAGGSNPWGALQTGTTLIINRSIPYTNLLNITDYASTPASTWNQGYDRATILAQQLYSLTQQSILQSVAATTPLSIPAPVANDILCWDPTGTFISNCATTTTTLAIPIVTAGYVNGSSLYGTGTMTKLTATNLISTGNMGIGSTNPGQALDVAGTVRSTSFVQTGSNINNFSGNVGINQTSPGQALDVVGTVRATSFTGQSGAGLFGTWTVKSIGTIYQASTDGIVVAWGQNATNFTIFGYTDSNTTPTTVRVEAVPPSGYPTSITFPVRKGDYYEAYANASLSTSGCYFISIGS